MPLLRSKNGVLCTFPCDLLELLGSDTEYAEGMGAEEPLFELDNQTPKPATLKP